MVCAERLGPKLRISKDCTVIPTWWVKILNFCFLNKFFGSKRRFYLNCNNSQYLASFMCHLLCLCVTFVVLTGCSARTCTCDPLSFSAGFQNFAPKHWILVSSCSHADTIQGLQYFRLKVKFVIFCYQCSLRVHSIIDQGIWLYEWTNISICRLKSEANTLDQDMIVYIYKFNTSRETYNYCRLWFH